MRPIVAIILGLAIVGCSSKSNLTDKGDYYVDSSFSSVSQNDRVRFLILHYTAEDDEQSLEHLTRGQVSAHYLLPSNPPQKNSKPIVLQLVPEEKRAWHAGVSNWNKRSNLNDSSIGIEIVNKGYTLTDFNQKIWYPFNDSQISALSILAKDIIKRNNITPDNVLGHSDIAPLRKEDPGKLFPWKKLADMGIGAWPDEFTVKKYLANRERFAPANVLLIQQLLSQYGYDKIPQTGKLDDETRKTISVFQMHFRPLDISGNADAETEAIAQALIEKYRT